MMRRKISYDYSNVQMNLGFEPLMLYLVTHLHIDVMRTMCKVDTRSYSSFLLVSKDQQIWRRKIQDMNKSCFIPDYNINWMHMYWLLKRTNGTLTMLRLVNEKKWDYLAVYYHSGDSIFDPR